MAPGASIQVGQKRKAPSSTFQPPRPLASKGIAPKPDSKSKNVQRRSLPTPRVRPRERYSAGDVTSGPSSDLDDDPSFHKPPDNSLISDEGSIDSDHKENIPDSSDAVPSAIPPALLTKLFHHSFTQDTTRIGTEARAVAGKYVETFVREAIARAAYEREEGVKERLAKGGKRSVGMDDFLEVNSRPSEQKKTRRNLCSELGILKSPVG